MWKIYRTDEFKDWFDSLEEVSISAIVTDLLILEKYGPSLGRPYVDFKSRKVIPRTFAKLRENKK